MFVERFLAWTLVIVSATVGTTMILMGMLEELPIIMRGTFRRATKWRTRN